MDGNRTHPGRLNSAPQTVLKTAEDTSPRSSPASRASILAVSPTNSGAARDEIRQPSRRPLPADGFEDRGEHQLPYIPSAGARLARAHELPAQALHLDPGDAAPDMVVDQS